MGGIFSGRKPALMTKPFPEEFISLDVRKLQREQLLGPGEAYNLHKYRYRQKVGVLSIKTRSNFLEVQYTSHEKKAALRPIQLIEVVWSNCNFGGRRPWFLCPAEQCGRRVAILYGPNPLLCRHCRRIAYQSQREDQIQRLGRILRSIEDICLRGAQNQGAQILQRPKGMHHRTFQRLRDKHLRVSEDFRRVQIEEIIKIEQFIDDWF